MALYKTSTPDLHQKANLQAFTYLHSAKYAELSAQARSATTESRREVFEAAANAHLRYSHAGLQRIKNPRVTGIVAERIHPRTPRIYPDIQ